MKEPTEDETPRDQRRVADDSGSMADLSRQLLDAQVLASQLLDQLSRLAAVPIDDGARPSPFAASASAATDAAAALANARAIVRGRAERGRLFGEDLFSDPVWDLMLDAFIAAESGRRVSVSSICIAARVPTTTALRWCRQLEERGVLVRVPDETDRRRSFLMLSAGARERMRALVLTMATGIL